ncbi:MAG: NUDIX domain-containing protein [Planctomycetaceae bacterium]|nr:NUDIX domain-containing protein [Planctomycetaceae bacterium]MCB9950575.1 NUDIX domain-containing protein [Planctomycetaceae bacterium]
MAKRIGIAVVEWEGSYLVGIRAEGISQGGKAEFPGGKCLLDESPEQCAVRECLEETGLAVVTDEVLKVIHHSYGELHLELTFVKCNPLDDVPTPLHGFRWVSTEELPRLDFPEANREVVALLMGT